MYSHYPDEKLWNILILSFFLKTQNKINEKEIDHFAEKMIQRYNAIIENISSKQLI
jgi:hypothetical protein